MWTSTDGLAWSRLPNEDALFGGVGGHVMWGVAFGGGRYVAVGVEGEVEGDAELGVHAAVWTSTDAVNWTRVPHDETVFGHQGQAAEAAVAMENVAHGAAGFVAVGKAPVTGDAAVPNAAAALWYSSDGIMWQRVPHDEGLFGGEETMGEDGNLQPYDVGLSAVAANGSTWVAVGREIAISWIWEPRG